MFAARFFAPRMFAPRFFAEAGANPSGSFAFSPVGSAVLAYNVSPVGNRPL